MKKRLLACFLTLSLLVQPFTSFQTAYAAQSDSYAEAETESERFSETEDMEETEPESEPETEDLVEIESEIEPESEPETENLAEIEFETEPKMVQKTASETETESELSPEEAALLDQFKSFDLDLYEAQLFTGTYKRDIDNVLKWQTPAEILAKDINDNTALQIAMTGWKATTFGGDTVTNKLSEVDACQMLILDMLDTAQDSDEVSEFVSDEYWNNMLKLSSNYCKTVGRVVSEEEGAIKDLFDALSVQQIVSGDRDTLMEAFGVSFDSAGMAEDIFNNCKTVYDLCSRLATYNTLTKYYGTTMPETIAKLKDYCKDSKMKEACDRVMSLLSDNASATVEYAMEGTNEVSKVVLKKAINKFIEVVFDASGLSVLLVGQKLGSLIANRVYNTDEICGKVYTIRQYQSLIEAARELVTETGNAFSSSQSSKDASIYINALSLYMTGAEKGSDYAKEFADAVRAKDLSSGQVKTPALLEDFKKSCDKNKNTYTNSKKFLLHDLWRYPFEEEYPEIVQAVCGYYGYAGWTISPVLVEQIKIGFTEISVKPGDPEFLVKAEILPSNATNQTIIYKTSNAKIATVTGDGWVKPVGYGTATITAYIPETSYQYYKSTSVKVTVSDANRSFTVEPYKYTVTREYSDEEASEKGFDGTVSIKHKASSNDTQIEVPSSVDFMGKSYKVTGLSSSAFSGDSYVTSVTLPDTIEDLGTYAFNKCNKLTKVTIPEGITEIGQYTFSETSVLSDVNLPEGIMKICKSAFYQSKIKQITLPESLVTIEEDAFEYSGLTSVTIPENVRTIGRAAFCDCYSLESVVIKGSPVIENIAFAGDSKVTSLDLGQSLSMGERAIDEMRITSLTIPKSMTSIDDWFYDECPNLQEIVVETDNTKYASKDKALFSKDLKIMYRYPDANSRTSYTVPSTVTEIYNNCFRNNLYLQKVILPSGLTTLRTQAFLCCRSLTGITIPGSVKTMGTYIFHGCLKMTSAIIGEGITNIPDRMFYNCQGLTSVSFPSTLKGIGIEAFAYCPVKTLTLPTSLEKIGAKAFYYNSFGNTNGATSVTIPASVSYIGNEAFRYNRFKTVTFAKGSKVLQIPNYCFSTYSLEGNLTSVTLPEYVQTIGQNAFANHNLTSVIIPASVYSIGSNAFYSSKKTTKIIFKGDPPTFSSNSFYSDMVFSTPSGIPEWTQAKQNRYYYANTSTSYDLAKCTVKSSTSLTYTGSAQTPAVTITYNGVRVPSYHYKITYANNKNIGQATITVAGTYNCSGTKKLTFDILPKQTAVSSLANSASGITIKWAKNTTATGYKIYRSYNGGSYTAIKTITSNATVSYTDTGATKNGYKYQYKIKAYKKVDTKYYYAGYGTAKTIYRLSRPTIKSLTAASRAFTLKWSANTKASGYQIQYSLSSTFASGNKTISVSGASSVSKKVTGLSGGKKYYVKMRSYKKVGTTKYYSAWTSKKYITVKR